MRQSEQPYLIPELRSLPLYLPRPEREFTAKRVFVHLLLFLTTCVTTTMAGALLPLVLSEALVLENPFDLINQALVAIWSPSGLAFAITLLIILGTHELGHYFACRYYRVRATLPFFIPFLPVIGIGTLGAFIRIKSPITSRRALFDIGIAGPIVGFIFAIPAAVIGLSIAAPETAPPPIAFNDPLLFSLIKWFFGIPLRLEWHPIWFAAWVGMIATSLNLLPVGQLDGGHIVYALFGKRGHKVIGLTVYTSVIGIAILAWFQHQWPGGLVYVVLLTIMLFAKHPPAGDPAEKLGRARVITAVIGLVIFLLSVMPFPMSIN